MDAYAGQAKALHDGGADVFLVETIFDTANSKVRLMCSSIFCLDAIFPMSLTHFWKEVDE